MTSTEIEVRGRPTGAPSQALMAAPLDARLRWAHELAAASLLPRVYQKQPASVLMALEYGEMIGLHHMAVINGVHVIEGKPSLSPELTRALIRRAGHKLRILEWTNESCTIRGSRKEAPDEPLDCTFTMADARTAGLTGKDVWKKYARSMLLARATTLLVRAMFEDVVFGMSYTPEELGAEVTESGEPVDITDSTTVLPPSGPPVRTDDERVGWASEWGKRFEAATSLDDLTALGHVVRQAEQSGHCVNGDGDHFRQLLRTRAGEMPATQQHLTRMHAALTSAGVKDDDDRRTAAGNVVGRRLESSHELTCAEADRVFEFVRNAPAGYDFVEGTLVPEGVGTYPDDTQFAQPGETE